MKIDGSVAIVVGGVRGMGRAFSDALLAKGCKLIVGDVLESEGDKMQTEAGSQYGADKVHFRKCDVTVQDEVTALFKLAEEKWGTHPDIVANVAGMIDEFNWKKVIDINLGGVINVTSCCLEKMGRDKGGKGGCLVHMASMSGLRPERFTPVYCASKHAVVGYTRSWASEENYAEHGIRINCICPTIVETDFLKKRDQPVIYYEEEIRASVDKMTNKLRPEQVAEAFIEVVEHDGINGEAVRVTDELGVDFATFEQQPSQ